MAKWHVYVSPSEVEYPTVGRCPGSPCSGCDWGDKTFETMDAADAYAARMAPDDIPF